MNAASSMLPPPASPVAAGALSGPIVSEPYDRDGTPGRACLACGSAWPASEPDAMAHHHANGCGLAAPVLSTAIVDVHLANENWAACREQAIAHVRKLEAAAREYLEASVALEMDGNPGQLRRTIRAEKALRLVLP